MDSLGQRFNQGGTASDSSLGDESLFLLAEDARNNQAFGEIDLRDREDENAWI